MPTIEEWRKKIDKLDKKIVRLLNERARFTDEIGKLKQKRGLPAYSPTREERVLRNVMKWNEGVLPTEVLRRLYERILDESRTLEKEAMDNRKPRGTASGSNSPRQKGPEPLRRARRRKRW
jgi:chorismate mutase-like protein